MSSDVIERISESLEKGTEVLLIVVPAERYVSTMVEILKYLSVDFETIYVTLNRPYSSVKKLLENRGIDPGKILFIDCITRQIGGEEIDDGRCMYLNSLDLSQIQVAIENAMNLLDSDKKFIYLDSLSTIALYKSAESLIRFIRYLTGTVRVKGFICTLFLVEKEMDDVYYSQISLMVDDLIEID